MTKTLKRSCAALLSLAMILSMLLYYPSGIWDPISFGLTASAAVDTTPTQPGTGDGSAESPYEIGTVGELYWFAGLVNGTLEGVTQNTAAHGKLTADITVNTGVMKADGGLNSGSFTAWTPIGSFSQPFTGSFDGNDHVVSGLYATGSEGVGFFGAARNSTIAKLGVGDSYFKGTNYVGGICGRITYSTITDCFANCCVSTLNAGGGICGYAYGGSIYNSFNLGPQSGKQGICGMTPDLYAENCYYLDGTTGDSNATAKTAEQFASGEVAYLLSEGRDDSSWGQNIGTDPYPVLGGAKVYKTLTYAGCNDTTTVLATNYSNTAENVYGDHGTYENGFCPVCGAYEPAVLNANNVYEIGNAGQLYWFAAMVNDGLLETYDAVLTADIVVNEDFLDADGNLPGDTSALRKWIPIGYGGTGTDSSNVYYGGKFDGKGHTISGLYFDNAEQDCAGVFGRTNENASISSLGVLDSYFHASGTVGAIVGYQHYTPIEKSYSSGSVVKGTENVGGITGRSYYGSTENCFSISRVSGTASVSGICGFGYGTIRNCYSMGQVTGNAISAVNQYLDILNCYALEGSASSFGVAAVKSADQFVSGEVAYQLSQGMNGHVWGQIIGTETVPALNSRDVYRNVTYAGCNDTTAVSSVSYSNRAGDTYGDHGAYENGFCPVCGAYEPAVLNTDGAYEIGNAGQLYWFAALVNAHSSESNAKAVLTADIVLNENVLDADGNLAEDTSTFRKWTPIGLDHFFNGIFDGQGHTISGLYFDDASASLAGLFAQTNNSKIRNVGLIHSYVRGDVSVGGISGMDDYSLFSQCYVDASLITAAGGGAGGIVGCANSATIRNCYSSSKISGISTVTGGMFGIGSAGKNSIENCYSRGISNCGRDSISLATMTNCYVLEGSGTPLEGETAKTAEEFASGEVAYLLSKGTYGDAWGQTLGTDAYPVPGGKKVSLSTGCVTYNNDGIDGEKAHHYVSEGETAHSCTDCGQSEAHAFTAEIASEEALHTPATCLNAAKYYKSCEGCGLVGTNAQDLFEYGEPLAHDYINGFCSACDAFEPAERNAEGVYQIGNAGQLYWFAGLVNGTLEDVEKNDSADAVLTDDIVVNENVLDADGNLAEDTSAFREWTPIGNYYRGIFDGQGHAISGLYFNNSDGEFAGLFGRVEGYDDKYSIKGVGVVKSYISGAFGVGAICGNSRYAAIERCYTKDSVIIGISDVGGICGWLEGNTIRDCYNGSRVSSSSTSSTDVGGICGYTEALTAKIQNCYNYGVSSRQAILTWAYIENPIQDCYALEGTGTTGEGITTVTAEQLASGEVAYLLSKGTDGDVWGQNIGTDPYPVLGGKKVFCTSGCMTYNNDGNVSEKAHHYVSEGETAHSCTDCGQSEAHAFTVETVSEETLYAPAACLSSAKYYKTCEVCGAVSTSEQDLFEYGEPLGHHFNEDGFCDACGAYEPAEQNAEGVYQISSAGQLYWFAGLVNGTLAGVDKNVSANAVLMNDITVNENVLNDDGGLNAGSYRAWTPIGSMEDPYGGTFDGNNHIISGLYFHGNVNGAGFIGGAYGATIQNLGVQDSYFYSINYVGGICGYMGYQSKLINCFANCCVSCLNACGGVCGYSYGGAIYNCFNLGPQSGKKGICGMTPELDARNCYYLEGTTGDDYGTVKTAEQFASGEVAYLLSQDEDGGSWGQNIGTDPYPVLGGAKVYSYLIYSTCDKSDAPTTGYSNADLEFTAPDHSYLNGICRKCGYFRNNIGTNLAGYTVTLDGTIGVNFHMMLDPRVIADVSAYMLFTLPDGRSRMVHMRDAAIKTVDGEEYYVFTCPVAPKDMYSSIKAQFVTSSGETATYRFTVEEYANYILDNPDLFTAKDVELVTAMLQYGRYAEAYFAGETLEAPANMSSVSPDALPNSEAVITGELPEGITYHGTTLVLNSELFVCHYFKVENGVTEIPYPLMYNQKGSYRRTIKSLLDGELDASVTIEGFTLEYNLACYVRKVLESEQAPENLKHLVFALYEFYSAEAAYMGLT